MKESSSDIIFLPPLTVRLNRSPEKLFPKALLFNFFRQVLTSFNFLFRHRFLMAPTGTFILGHSFIRRLTVFLSSSVFFFVIQLGNNDLSSLSAVETGSALQDLSHLLHESYGVQRICVCQTIFRGNAPLFNHQVKLLTKYLKVVLEPIPYVLYWGHRGFWNCKSRFLTRNGVRLNHPGHYKFFRSLRGAVLQCLRSLQASG